ncbi:hypothetical protein N7E02_19930 [Aliirhizobium terrae]|uniref:hypothetical protein n=1 Tax=Terrirhizobium terrae TaxID=2926709 RepID=UPI0025775158|nr:hypothetical protein [Rhizobium sp. CC-CFT758]WJH39144.1 hypothetical protein N7E02_19930 [Rhizobium sp. CC-CFT758]
MEGFPAKIAVGNPFGEDGRMRITNAGFLAGRCWESHAWICCEDMIVDVTADQFGGDRLIITHSSDLRYCANGLDAASRLSMEARRTAVAQIWPEWLAYRRDHLPALL